MIFESVMGSDWAGSVIGTLSGLFFCLASSKYGIGYLRIDENIGRL